MWESTRFLSGAKLRQPSLFVTGELDPVLTMYREHFDALEETMPNLRKKVVLPGAGHWIQQERPAAVNELLVEFLSGPGRRDEAHSAPSLDPGGPRLLVGQTLSSSIQPVQLSR